MSDVVADSLRLKFKLDYKPFDLILVQDLRFNSGTSEVELMLQNCSKNTGKIGEIWISEFPIFYVHLRPDVTLLTSEVELII